MLNQPCAYIVAARRSALGNVGGLHRSRRIEQLTAPVVTAALDDCGIDAARVEDIIIGNALQGGNPARIIALSAGLPETAAATTIDRQCASGLDAIVAACRSISAGEASIVVAGGAESVSTAPWRIAKPRSLYQIPHFLSVEPATADEAEEPVLFEASEDLSRKLNISRDQQDAWALKSYLKAAAARDARRFVGEIVPLRANAEEARDQSAVVDPSLEELSQLSPFLPPEGTLTPGNTSAMHDGAAIAVVVSENVWQELGRPRALRLIASASAGVAPHDEATAPVEAMQKLYGRMNGFNPKDIGVVELSESSAAQAIAFGSSLGLDDAILNPDGGAVVRGHPFAAAGAVLVVRLFTDMIRGCAQGAGGREHEEACAPVNGSGGKDGRKPPPRYGVAALGAIGGIAVATLFEAV